MDRLISPTRSSARCCASTRPSPTRSCSRTRRKPRGRAHGLRHAGQAADRRADDIPAEHRIRGIEGVRTYSTLEDTLPFAQHLGFKQDGDRLVLEGSEGQARWYFSPKTGRPSNGMHVGVWHHMALGCGAGRDAEVARLRGHGPDPVDARVRPLLLRLLLLDVAPAAASRCAHRPGRASSSTRSSKTLGNRLSLSPRTEPLREARARARGDREPAPARQAAKAAKGGKKAIKATEPVPRATRRYRRRRTARSPESPRARSHPTGAALAGACARREEHHHAAQHEAIRPRIPAASAARRPHPDDVRQGGGRARRPARARRARAPQRPWRTSSPGRSRRASTW